MTGTEAQNTTNKCTDFVKSYLKSKYGYSDEYLNILSTVTDNLISTDGPYTEEEINSLAAKKREELKKAKNWLGRPKYKDEEVEQLVQEYIESLRKAGHNNGGEILDTLSNRLSNILHPTLNETTSSSSKYTHFSEYNDTVGGYIDNLIKQKCKDLGLSSDEQEAFCAKLYKTLGATKDKFGSYEIDNKTIQSLDKNGDNSPFDEILSIAMDLLSQTKHMSDDEIDNAQYINGDELFDYGHVPALSKMFGGTKEVLSAKDILNNYNEMKLSDDPGIRKFVKLLDSAFDKFDCLYDSDKEDVISNLLKLLNKAGNTFFSSDNLKQKTFDKLNNGDIFNTIQEIINSQKFYYMNMLDIDGDIDDFKQGFTGDCWLLAGIDALSATSAGQKIIRQQIQWADDYSSVTVYFAGIDQYVTLSAESIIEAKEEGQLSRGDGDVLILELAMKQVYGDIEGDYSETFWSRFIKDGDLDTYKNMNKGLAKLWQAKQEGKNFAATFYVNGSCSCKCKDGSSFEYESNGAHALAITDITSSTVTFVNPWDAGKEYTVTWEEFNKLTAYQISMYSF